MKITDNLLANKYSISGKENITRLESKSENVKSFSRGTLEGDWRSDFKDAFTRENDKHSAPVGAAQGSIWAKGKTIDKTSELYEKALVLESYFVQQVMKSMRTNIGKGILGEESSAGEFYADMLFDKYTEKVTLSSGLGLADLIYLQTDEHA